MFYGGENKSKGLPSSKTNASDNELSSEQMLASTREEDMKQQHKRL